MEDDTQGDTADSGGDAEGSLIDRVKGSLNTEGVPDDNVELVEKMLGFWKINCMVQVVCCVIYAIPYNIFRYVPSTVEDGED